VADSVAAIGDAVYAIQDNNEKPGDVLVYLSAADGYTEKDCWWDFTAADDLPKMTTIGASYGDGGDGPVTATDDSGNVYNLMCISPE
jgi:hypothetical protein